MTELEKRVVQAKASYALITDSYLRSKYWVHTYRCKQQQQKKKYNVLSFGEYMDQKANMALVSAFYRYACLCKASNVHL